MRGFPGPLFVTDVACARPITNRCRTFGPRGRSQPIIPRHLFLSTLLLLPCASADSQDVVRTPVLVELFTSEGCSSCPPADALLARLDHDQPIPAAEVIVLGEHVDYWDSLGWRDRFSSHLLTERQSSYGARFHLQDIYTPQMVIAGRTQINGSDAAAAARAIVQSARIPGIPLVLSDVRADARHVTATLTVPSPGNEPAELFAAVIAPSETTQVRSGENGGRTLHHVGVVRSLTPLGSPRDIARGPIHVRLDLPTSGQNLRLVVFAQAARFGPVLGVATVGVPASSHDALAELGK